jgi:hypothetical protein
MQFAAQSAKTALAVQLSFFPITRTITITAAPDHLLLILIQNREPRLVIIACMSITYTPARSNLDRNCIPAVEQFQIVPEAAEATPKKKNQAHAADRQKVPRRRRIVFIAKLAPRQVVLPPPTLVEFLLAFLVMSVGNWIGRRNGDFIGFETNCLRMRAALGRSELVLAAELDRFRTSSPDWGVATAAAASSVISPVHF